MQRLSISTGKKHFKVFGKKLGSCGNTTEQKFCLLGRACLLCEQFSFKSQCKWMHFLTGKNLEKTMLYAKQKLLIETLKSIIYKKMSLIKGKKGQRFFKKWSKSLLNSYNLNEKLIWWTKLEIIIFKFKICLKLEFWSIYFKFYMGKAPGPPLISGGISYPQYQKK